MYVFVAANNYPILPANTTPPERPPFEGFYRGPTPQQALLAMHMLHKAAANSHMSEHAQLVGAALGFDAAATATATSVVDTRHYHHDHESPPARRPSDEDTRSTPTSQGSSRCAH